MKFDVALDADKAKQHLQRLPDAVRAELVTEAEFLDGELVARARLLASGDLVNVRSGRYVRSIKGRVTSTRTVVTGKAYSRAPEAHLIETGAVRGPRDILPNAAQAMTFVLGGHRVFAKRVHHPGSVMRGRYVLHTALDEMRVEIISGMRAAMNRGLAHP